METKIILNKFLSYATMFWSKVQGSCSRCPSILWPTVQWCLCYIMPDVSMPRMSAVIVNILGKQCTMYMLFLFFGYLVYPYQGFPCSGFLPILGCSWSGYQCLWYLCSSATWYCTSMPKISLLRCFISGCSWSGWPCPLCTCSSATLM